MHFTGGLAIKVDPVTDVSQEKSDQHHTQWENISQQKSEISPIRDILKKKNVYFRLLLIFKIRAGVDKLYMAGTKEPKPKNKCGYISHFSKL
jgi:hypothetical protein